jgi:hypothetical protein
LVVYGYAHRSFVDDAVPDIERLIEFHAKETGTGRGRRRPAIQVVSRSAVVLTCASWEAFCEDLAAEALRHFAEHAADGDALPKQIKKTIKKSLLALQDELAVWALAGNGWRSVLRQRADLLASDADRTLNTPKPDQVKEFFLTNVGISNITSGWSWRRNPPDRTTKLLEEFVVLRGSIAHRGSPDGGVLKRHATEGLELVRRLAELSAKQVSQHLESHTTIPLPSFDDTQS